MDKDRTKWHSTMIDVKSIASVINEWTDESDTA